MSTDSVATLRAVLHAALRHCKTQKACEELLYELLGDSSLNHLLFLQYDWPTWTRTDQTAPAGDWTTWLMLGGRGAGKTRAGAEWVRGQAVRGKSVAERAAVRIALIGETLGQARQVMVEGVSGLLAAHPPDERPVYEPSKRQLVWPGGTVAQLFSAEDPDSLRGPQFDFAWCDELAKWRYPERAWDMLQFGLRLGTRPCQVVTTTPRPIPLLKRLLSDSTTLVSRARTHDNARNLAPTFLQTVVGRYRGTRLGRQELDAEILDDRPEALWPRPVIEAARLAAAPELARIVVAVDPPVSSGTRADACGIVVAGRGHDGRAYVLEDATLERARPLVWARAAVAAYHRHQADRIVAEVNQGGELVEAVIRQVAPDVPVRLVRAARGKWVRAEPVAALYERGLVAHVGALPSLEDQMCDFGPDGLSDGRSPDRVDALVWALTDLALTAPPDPRLRAL